MMVNSVNLCPLPWTERYHIIDTDVARPRQLEKQYIATGKGNFVAPPYR